MDDKEFEKLLIEIGNEPVIIPVDLVQRTKAKIKNKNFLSTLRTAAFFNGFSLVSLTFIACLKFNILELIFIYTLWSFTSSLTILTVILFMNHLKSKSGYTHFNTKQ